MKQDKAAEIALSERIYEDTISELKEYIKRRQPYLDSLGISSLKGKLILDAGCGTGMDGVILSKLDNDNKVVGIDISPKAVNIATKRAKKEQANFHAIIGDIERLPFKDETFDACFTGWTLHHFPEIELVLSELARVLKPGGSFYLIEPNGFSLAVKISKFFENAFIRLIKEAGADSPNETLHNHTYYIKALKECGFTNITVNFCYFGGLPPLPKAKTFKRQFLIVLLRLFIHIRRILYLALFRILPRPLNGIDLLITACLNKRS